MAYTDLRDWIKPLEKAGELKRITAEVSPDLEMAEIADRTAKLGRGTPKSRRPRPPLRKRKRPSRRTSPDEPVRQPSAA